MEDLAESETHPAAAEGTACGELLQAMLEQRTLTPQVPGCASNGVNFDADMYFFAGEFARQLLELNVQVLCEERIDWVTNTGFPIRGQYDASYFLGNTLCIDDLKYGWRLVEVKENWQLIGYAIGKFLAAQSRGIQIDAIRLRIYQPRPHHEDGWLREWTIGPSDLAHYYNLISQRMAEIQSGNDTLETGSHCRYCPAGAEACPAMNRAFYNSVDVTLSNFEQDALNEDEIAQQLELLDRVKEIIKIKADSLEALAQSRIKGGKIIKGFVIEQTLGNRTWKPGVNAQVLETMLGRSVMEPAMLSPSKVEKLKIPKDFIDTMTVREMKGTKLVRKDSGALGDKVFGTQQPKGIS